MRNAIPVERLELALAVSILYPLQESSFKLISVLRESSRGPRFKSGGRSTRQVALFPLLVSNFDAKSLLSPSLFLCLSFSSPLVLRENATITYDEEHKSYTNVRCIAPPL
jgi:hypothetical protein